MWPMRVCLFEDHADNLEPLSLTRPVFDLICGRTSLAWKQLRYWAPREYGLILRPHLQELALLGNTTMRVNDFRCWPPTRRSWSTAAGCRLTKWSGCRPVPASAWRAARWPSRW